LPTPFPFPVAVVVVVVDATSVADDAIVDVSFQKMSLSTIVIFQRYWKKIFYDLRRKSLTTFVPRLL